jgi:dihydropyrimidinase
MTVKGCASHTISAGKVVYANGELNVVRGAGRYVERPPFATFYDALQKKAEINTPKAVDRS